MLERRVKIIVTILALMIGVHIVNIILGGQLLYFGIRPLDRSTLLHILSAPWLHGSWSHLGNNLFGLAVFSALSLLRGPKLFINSSAIIIVLSGVLIWFFARPGATHIGASGWIFGLWSLSMALAWFQRNFVNIAVAIFVAVFYGGMIWGVLPSNPYVSHEAHLFGALAGVVAAYCVTRKSERRRR